MMKIIGKAQMLKAKKMGVRLSLGREIDKADPFMHISDLSVYKELVPLSAFI